MCARRFDAFAPFSAFNSGGWGWWENDDDDLWMTSYVLYGLSAGAAPKATTWSADMVAARAQIGVGEC